MSDPRLYPGSANSAGNPIIIKQRRYSLSLTPASVVAAISAEQDLSVPGVVAGDVIVGVQNPAFGNATGVVGCRVKADNTIAITFVNPTAGALTPGAGTWDFLVNTYK